MIAGILFVTFDYVLKSSDGVAQLDLLPDFIGYGLLAFGYYRIMKNAEIHSGGSGSKHVMAHHVVNNKTKKKDKQTKQANNSQQARLTRQDYEKTVKITRYGMAAAVLMMLLSYGTDTLNLYGMIQRMPVLLSTGIRIVCDLGMVLVMLIYIKLLEALQGQKCHFQVKRMRLILMIIVVCVICEYISMFVQMVLMSFLIFEQMAEVMFMVYMFASDRTYKEKFLKEDKAN